MFSYTPNKGKRFANLVVYAAVSRHVPCRRRHDIRLAHPAADILDTMDWCTGTGAVIYFSHEFGSDRVKKVTVWMNPFSPVTCYRDSRLCANLFADLHVLECIHISRVHGPSTRPGYQGRLHGEGARRTIAPPRPLDGCWPKIETSGRSKVGFISPRMHQNSPF